ncbi:MULTISPECIES: hypothetical protein [unclassified Undibacterium]|uniref:hypothetical protein n=1 Tax=unclassified Undibacterium TaxID=2630295 RepID=UPI002AC9978A|nr:MULTISPECIES: hypothetical protein [unclassified Undibacterium]MEB0137643.1 hypothetical protein [Undibacterium sp. CCC2.1]MEB0170644.1 hypothetical protein [Undibacterium sp. CCC1.1]MEB0174585.1 hypothetical protein [Undibacterium sp. CCC3.4]MEB0213618.1 hypothetical protein [Undibacterium sp. 5I2]WPX43786.1 hypothetical protein RHM61_00685 [Undibacterium sp. CCC3.4]
MKFTSQIKVLGMKASKGTLENGSGYDSTKIYVETGLDDSKGNAKGFSAVEYSFGMSDEYAKYKHLTFPFMAEATLEIVTTGKIQKTQLIDLKPIEMVKQPKAA